VNGSGNPVVGTGTRRSAPTLYITRNNTIVTLDACKADGLGKVAAEEKKFQMLSVFRQY